jgi:hypothetical protein
MNQMSRIKSQQVLITAGLASLGLATLTIAQPAQAFTIYSGGAAINPTVPVVAVQDSAISLPSGATTARTNFLNAAGVLGNTQVQGFEGLTTVPSNISVTNSASPTAAATREITSNLGTNNLAFGFNVVGAGNYLRIAPATVSGGATTNITFNYATGLRAFGLFVTDFGNTLNGSNISIFVNNSNTALGTIDRIGVDSSNARGARFFGITQQSSNPLITSVTLRLSNVSSADRFGIDGVYTTPVPVPPQFIGSLVFGGLAFLKKKRQQKLATIAV